MPQVGSPGVKSNKPTTKEELLRRALFGILRRLGAFNTDTMPPDADLLKACSNYQKWNVRGPNDNWLAPPNPELDDNIPF